MKIKHLKSPEDDPLAGITDEDIDAMSDDELNRFHELLLGSTRDPLYPYINDPAGWCESHGIFIWSKQREILESIRDNRFTAVVATHGVGKSFLAGNAAVWWGDQHPIEDVNIVTTAPTGRQVKAILWQEIQKSHRRAKAPGKVSTTQWKIGNDLIGFGSKPADPAGAEGDAAETGGLQGSHAEYQLIIIDECAGVHPQIWADVRKLMTGVNNRLLVIGNPDVAGSVFHKAARSELYNTIHISYEDSPAATGEDVPDHVARALVSQIWVDEAIEEHGVDSSYVQRLVYGKFVTDRTDGVILESHLRNAALVTPKPGERTVGVDVGGGGKDRTVCRLKDGNQIGAELIVKATEPKEMAEAVAGFCEAHKATRVHVDEIGVGRGLIGHLRHLLPGIPIHGINVAERAHNKNADYKCKLRRDELWWEFRVALKAGDISWPGGFDDDEPLLEELTTTRWYEHQDAIKVEGKDDIKKRLGRSPDRADAVLLASCSPTYQTLGMTLA